MSTVPDVGSDTGRWDLRRCLPSPLAVVGLVAGVLAIFSPVVLSGLEVTLSGLGDPRLVNYTLEHGYRWLLGYPLHADFWSPPIFYPHANVSAYTDVLVGVGPFYWCWRLLGWAPDTALLLWMLTVWSLNYIAVYVLLRRFFQVGPLGATAGSLLFTFGAPRTLNFAHLQLAPNFYAIIVIMALFRVFGRETDPLWRRRWIAVGTLAIVLQAYTAFYPFYLLFLGLALTAIWGLVFADSRANAARRLRREWAMFLAAAVVGGVLIWPLAGHYMRAQDELSDQRFVVNNIPRPASWILMGPRNLMYGWLQSRTGPYADLRGPLHSNGIGFVPLGLSLLGLWWGRRRRAVQLVFLAVLGVFVLSTMFTGGFSFWRYAHEYLPGASALRATGRLGMVLLLLGAVGAALFFERLQSRRRYLVAGLCTRAA